MADAPDAPEFTFVTEAPQSAMSIVAHPDDTEFSCGGTLFTWARAGAEITMVVITDGSKGSPDRALSNADLIAMRKVEQDRAAAHLGVARVVYLDYEDGVLQPTIALRRDIARVIRRYKPQVVITGDPDARFGGDFYINHPDHRVAAEAALYGIFPAADNHNFYPELLAEGFEPHVVEAVYITQWGEGKAVVELDDAAVEAKLAALGEHRSQFKIEDVMPFVRERTEETSKKYGVPYAESYRKITLREPRSAREGAEAEAAQAMQATDAVAEESREVAAVGGGEE